MIVTCPGCSSKYRVRDEAVPAGGAELKCPSCGAVFVAHPPKHSEEEIATALERITKAKEAAEQKLAELESQHAALERRAAEAEARSQKLDAQVVVLRSELVNAQTEARNLMGPLEAEVARLRDENVRAMARANAAQDAEMRVLQLTEELARARAAANHAPEVNRLTEELQSAQKTTGRLYTDLDVEKQKVARLEEEVRTLKSRAGNEGETTAEIRRLKDELSRTQQQAQQAQQQAQSAPANGNVGALVSAVGPMLWGLEQAIKYLEPYGANEAALAAHVRQLQLLQVVLQRLQKESS
jgi:predicted Zn finger-like uncharacterized protein